MKTLPTCDHDECGVTKCSNTTAVLIDLLKSRDQSGREKHGTTLDRADLTPEEWAKHAVQESLDHAGYLVRWVQTNQELVKAARDECDARLMNLVRENVALREEITMLKANKLIAGNTPNRVSESPSCEY